jgi:hypothetical protein
MFELDHTPYIDKQIIEPYAINIVYRPNYKFIRPKMAQFLMNMFNKAFT